MTAAELRQTIANALAPQRWLVRTGGSVRTVHMPERSERWEVFRGHLLDPDQTRHERVFECWDVLVRLSNDGEEQPLVGLKLDAGRQVLHVIRRIRVLAWEAYDAGNRVIESREAEKWLAELIGTIDLARVETTEASFYEHLEHYLHLAVVGVSRLPITSLESPLPAFSLGQLGYPGQVTAAFTRSLADKARALELALRAVPTEEVSEFARLLVKQWRRRDPTGREWPLLLRTLFNQLALSPYTCFVDNLVACIVQLGQELGPDLAIDALSYYLRHLVRHLTAYDLVTFHNLGSNYPDALALEAFLAAYVQLVEEQPRKFADEPGEEAEAGRVKQLRRRALRQALLVRKRYEGHWVPDAPTSPGENRRILPSSFPRVPEEQILQPQRRRRQLFVEKKTEEFLTGRSGAIFDLSLTDLDRPEELQELGMALFLDRPLGFFKERGEADRTPLLSYEAFSLQIVAQRLDDLRRYGFLDASRREQLGEHLEPKSRALRFTGIPAADYSGVSRPGVVALEDALRAGQDFLFLRTTASSLRELLSHYDLEPLRLRDQRVHDWLSARRNVLLIRAAAAVPVLVAFDVASELLAKAEFALASTERSVEYVEWLGTERLREGLRVTRLNGRRLDQPVVLPPRFD